MNRWFGSLAWYWASCRSIAASRALFVPAPTMPRPKMALCATSLSLSCENLLRVSRMFSLGFDTEIRARARGTAFLITGSPYRNRCPNARKAISEPISSPIAMRAMPRTATLCWLDRSGGPVDFSSLSSFLSFLSSFFSSFSCTS
uniref:Putative secreted protein n=1 Tax=Ixodes ricinus TaxID=34613 RepID=A0A6B0UU63_IXORI